MVRISNSFVAVVNIITLLLSLSVIGLCFYLLINQTSACQKFLPTHLFIIGIFILLVSLFGLIGSCFRIQFFMWIYLIVMFLLILGLFCFTIFIIIVTNKGVGNVISGKGFKEYRLGDCSNWVQNNLNEKQWNTIRSCLVDVKICQKLHKDSKETAADFSTRNLSPTESGCCKPPTYCGYEFQNATFWIVPKSGPTAPDSDCKTWENDQSKLCYDCNSCKAGFVANIKKKSLELILISLGVLIFSVAMYSVGCCALRNNQYRPYPRSKAHA